MRKMKSTLFCHIARIGNLRPAGRIRPAEAFYPPRDHLLPSGARPFFFCNNRYAAINRWKDPHLLVKTFFLIFVINSSKKRPELLAKIFLLLFFLFAINSPEIIPKFQTKTFLFWSAGMVAACWNLVRTGCGPLVQKVADPCHRGYHSCYEASAV